MSNPNYIPKPKVTARGKSLGRPSKPQSEQTQSMTFSASPDVIATIETYMSSNNCNRSSAINTLIRNSTNINNKTDK